MQIRSLLAIAASLAGAAVHTGALALTYDTQATCTSTLSINATSDHDLSLVCQGDLTLTGGSVDAANSLSLLSTGTITLTDVSLWSAAISFEAPSGIFTNGNVVVTARRSDLFEPMQPIDTHAVLTVGPGTISLVAGVAGEGGQLQLSSSGDGVATGESVYTGNGQVVIGQPQGVPSTLISQVTAQLASGGPPTIHVTAVPEASTWAYMAVGLTGLAAVRRRQAPSCARGNQPAC